jgi:hypothetical protein
MQLENEVRVSLRMMKYYTYHGDNFDQSPLPIIITSMKFTSAMLVEVANILLLCNQNSV